MSDDPQLPDEPKTPEEQEAPKPSLAGLVVVGALVLFGCVLFLANFSGQVSDPANGETTNRAKSKAKMGKSKARRAKPKAEEDLWHTAIPANQAAAPDGAVNLVVVSVAALRRDHLGAYGGSAEHTPVLTALAGRGARFADVIGAAPFSRTNGIAMLAGVHATSLDLVEPRSKPNERPVPAEVTLLAERLSDAGWQTFGVTANFNYNVDGGLAQGFHHHRDSQPLSFAPQQRLDAPDAVQHALNMLDGRSTEERGRPFYVQLTLVDPHMPLRTYDEEITAAGDVPNPPYVAAVQRIDRSVGTLLEGLAELGHADDTVVAFVASHGEGLSTPEHHGKMHGRLLFESSVVVPWIIAGPGVKSGHLVGGLTSTLDISPTLLELLGLPVPNDIEGQSWAAQLRGDSAVTTREHAISDTWYFQANRASIWTTERQCQKDFGTQPVLQDGFVDGCYDRRTDPLFTNLVEDPALMAVLVAWRTSLEGVVTLEGAPSPEPAGGEPEPGEATPSEPGDAP